MRKNIKKDEWGYVLDFLPKGYYGMKRPIPIAHVLGEKYFSLLEVTVREGVTLNIGDKVYIGDGKRKRVKYIKERLSFDKLTGVGKQEIEEIIEKIIEKNEKRFVDFFNRAGLITTRMHALELLPGIGKKHLKNILEERKKKPFETIDEIKKRIETIPNPKKMILKRILIELKDEDKYRIFVPRFEKVMRES